METRFRNNSRFIRADWALRSPHFGPYSSATSLSAVFMTNILVSLRKSIFLVSDRNRAFFFSRRHFHSCPFKELLEVVIVQLGPQGCSFGLLRPSHRASPPLRL